MNSPAAAGLRRTVPARFALRVLLAVLASTPVVRAQCVVGVNGGLQFGPGTWAHAPASGVLDGLGDFTIETFVQTTAPTGYLVDRFRCCNGTTTDDAFSLSIVNGKPNIELAAASGAYASVSATQTVNDGTWRHVAVVRSGATTTFYVDGAPAGSFMFAPALGATGGKTAFGVSQTPAGTPSGASFNGSLDEVRIWNVARTPAEVAYGAAAAMIGSEPGLLAYWRFDESPGQQALFNAATSTGAILDGVLGATALVAADDPTRLTSNLPPLPYCPACPAPPCGQVNGACATLLVNGVGAGAQGPFAVAVPPGGTLTFAWSGPPLQPYALVATSQLVPGQVAFSSSFVIDVDLSSFTVLYSGFDPVLGPLYVTGPTGTSSQSWSLSNVVPLGLTLHVQGLMYDAAQTCTGGLGFMTTASFTVTL